MLRRITLFTVLVMACTCTAWSQTSSGRITITVDLSAHGSELAADLWLPYPVTDRDQTISDAVVEGSFSASGVYTDRTHGTPMLHARWDKGVTKRILAFSFSVTRNERVRSPFPPKETVWDPADWAMYLGATRLGPIDGEIKDLAESITAGKTRVLDKAKAIYDWTCENTYRNPETRGCGFGDVYRLLKEPGGKCADISSIYVALARAAGVPTREIFGIRQGRNETQDISTWQHCWAEFYLPGHGWVPVDPADVRKMMLKAKLDIDDPKTAYYRDYFWGGIDPYRVRLGQGRDLILSPPQSGEPINYLMYPFAQVGDRTLDWLDPAAFSYTITFQHF